MDQFAILSFGGMYVLLCGTHACVQKLTSSCTL